MEANELSLVVNYGPHLRSPQSQGPVNDLRSGRGIGTRPAESGEVERAAPGQVPSRESTQWGRTGLDE
jgi:hypothetical protein